MNESICSICGKPEEVTGTDGAGELTYKPHKHDEEMIAIELPKADLSKTLGLIIDIYNPADPEEVLKTHLCNQLYTYRRKMIDDAKHIDKKRGKELEKWL